MGFLNFFKTSAPAPLRTDLDEQGQKKYHRSLAFQSFIAGTIGYSLYYVCRTSLNVMKDPILESNMLKEFSFDFPWVQFESFSNFESWSWYWESASIGPNTQLGIIGAVLLFAYAIGKLINGFIADHSNIKRFMAAGLLVSTLANLTMGVVGLFGSNNDFISEAIIPSFAVFVIFAIMWGVNGWSQSMGAPPAIIALSRWFPLSRRGTFYGFFSASHNIGEWLSFIFVGSMVSIAGWQWGFFGSALAGAIGVVIILFMMHDTPESKGLPSIEVLTGEKVEVKKNDESVGNLQKQVLRNYAVWILALASAFMYISRYSLNSWGILFLQKEKGFTFETATFIISINALLGIVGTVLAGWMSDVLFKGDRKMPAFVSGILLSISYAMFIYGGDAYWVNVLSMVLFGIAIGVLIAFLGGLMAVDIVPRKATGAALGIVGMASYVAAGLQDVVSGWIIDNYGFQQAAIFWIGASVISFLLPMLLWGKKKPVDE